ncbi:MAG TPA: pyridoxamine 5'-phosphate oxidase family protein [Anaerolineae bacterium]|nr:pyridoxamine 5'-phosphate oxidase family protein [Anaerolineae bacterium]HMR63700.1 pyridoxamine 5'-phosphate oxidase family protein [Anaerolineae bacterium]
MFTDAVREFLQKPLIARLSTIDPNGYPHTVPVWFKLDGEEVVVISVSNTRKVAHIRANPKGALTIGGEPGDGAGYLIKGEFSIEADPEDTWVRRLTYHYESPEQAEQDIAAWADLDILVLRLKPKLVLKVM